MTLEIKGLDDISKSLSNLVSDAVMGKALASAINKTTASAKTQMSKSVREVYNIKKKDLDPKIQMLF